MSFPDHGVNRKDVDNVENYLNMILQPKPMTHSQENGQKTHFWKKLLKNVQQWVKMRFPNHGVRRKVVDNVENYLNMQFQPKLMTHFRENGQKPVF